jgi:hypothetical protein
MKPTHLLLTGVIAFATVVTPIHASDPMALYGRVDRVVLEPAAGDPDAIQVWGVFALAKPNDRNDYLPPARGYLYFKLAANPVAALKEWADLKEVAGTNQVISLGSRYVLRVRLRSADEHPADPDPYVVNIGVSKVRGNTAYAPVRALLDYRH